MPYTVHREILILTTVLNDGSLSPRSITSRTLLNAEGGAVLHLRPSGYGSDAVRSLSYPTAEEARADAMAQLATFRAELMQLQDA